VEPPDNGLEQLCRQPARRPRDGSVMIVSQVADGKASGDRNNRRPEQHPAIMPMIAIHRWRSQGLRAHFEAHPTPRSRARWTLRRLRIAKAAQRPTIVATRTPRQEKWHPRHLPS